MTQDINSQNLCSMEIKLISSMNKSSNKIDLIFLPKGDRGEDGDNAKGNVMLCALPLCIFNDICFERNLGAKFRGDCGILLNGKARTDLITINLCEGWGTFVVENITNDLIKFAVSILYGVGLKITPISLLQVTLMRAATDSE
jgi:hypothetical protein